MANYREIVTKAVIAKGKKLFTTENKVNVENSPSTILGCWVINHNFNGVKSGDNISINGSYDVNIWYSYDNNTKTNVIARTFNYSDIINVNLKDKITDTNEIIVRSLKQPTVSNVDIKDGVVNLRVEKELGVEIVGDIKVKINVLDDYDDYEEDNSNLTDDINIDEDYLNKKN